MDLYFHYKRAVGFNYVRSRIIFIYLLSGDQMTQSERERESAKEIVLSEIHKQGHPLSWIDLVLAGISHERARQAEYVKGLEDACSDAREMIAKCFPTKDCSCRTDGHLCWQHQVQKKLRIALAELDKLKGE